MIKLYGYNGVAEAGFPDIVCPVVFLKGCNMKCPYCLNRKLVVGDPDEIDIEKNIEKMKENKEDSVLISGGEPCLSNYLNDLIVYMNSNGFRVLLSTNGSCPDIIEELVKNKNVVFFAVDIKSGFCNKSKWELVSSNPDIANNVLKTINIIENSNVPHEFRTTLYPPIVDLSDVKSISDTINKKSTWILQQFRKNNKLLNEEAVKDVQPYSEAILHDFVQLAKKNIDNVGIRYT